jgi:hypothetical protein
MRGNRLPVLLLLLVFSWLAHQPNWMLAQTTAEQQAQKLDEFLSQGKLVAAASHFRTLLEQQPTNQTARLALGLTEFFQALEFLGNSNYRFGILNNSATESLPLLRLPVPENPNPTKSLMTSCAAWSSSFRAESARRKKRSGKLRRAMCICRCTWGGCDSTSMAMG